MCRLVILPLLFCASAALAQAQPPAADPSAEGRQNQKVERIRIEDAGSRIDEVRYAGQTQSITVQPKANVPQYEVQPTTGQRFWNVFRF